MAQQINAAQLKPGMTYMTHYGPRVVTRVFQETEAGRRWLKWTWKPQPRKDGGMDCGYGGVLADSAEACRVTVEVQS